MTRKPRLLDLFCGAGGSAMGYARAGFEVIGVDVVPQKNYPFAFHQADALELLIEGWTTLVGDFDVIHASPPCQHYSDLAHRNGNADEHPDLIGRVRTLIQATRLPYVIENVEGAPLLAPTWLCGTMFDELAVIRHRGFESSMHLSAPPHGAHPLVYTRDKRKAHYGRLDEATSYVSVNGGGNCSVVRAREAMGIGWMTKAELNEAVPPAYTEYLGKQLIAKLTPSPAIL